MRAFTVSLAAVRRCPDKSMAPEHWRADGTCLHYRADQDGQAYVGYYRNDDQLGFMWDGDPDHEVHVCHGGMGEPLIASFLWRIVVEGPEDPSLLMLRFQHACDQWAEGWGASDE